ncbi:MFS transporter [Kribbella sp. NPDC050124]|uniref:MFS transporter n=1 Tax=Kribbella sp. NPDC050124 TaxID=3364114 RepID=UPI0037ACE886
MTTPYPRRWWALAALALVQFVIVVDNTVVNVALPSIQRELGFSVEGLSWVVNGYLLTAGGLLLLGGRLSDLLGRRRMFLCGAVVFAVASVVCGFSTSPAMLVAGRFGQGVGEALASPAALSLIAVLFPEPGPRGNALAIWGGLSGVGATVGVLLSGVITELLDWRWIFVLNLPCTLAAVILVPRLVPAFDRRRPGQVDWLGAALATTGSISLVYGILASIRSGWTGAAVVIPLIVSLLSWVAFVVVEARVSEPLVPPRFFANRTRLTANVVSVFMLGVLSALFLILTLYMQDVLRYSPLRTGLAYLPFCVFFVAGAALGALLLGRLGPRLVLTASFLVAAVGMVLASRLPVAGSWTRDLLPDMAVLAIGFGLGLPALQAAALYGVSERDAGLASGVQSSVQQLANALGIAVLLTVALHRSGAVLADGGPAPAAMTAGFRLAFAVSAGVLVLGAVAVAAVMRRVPASVAVAAEDPEPVG